MTPVELLGWTATIVGTFLATPQLVRLARTGNVEGLSLVGWQTALVLNIAWAMHGINIGQAATDHQQLAGAVHHRPDPRADVARPGP